jgi:GNAT superfamily N-acetyltransferase
MAISTHSMGFGIAHQTWVNTNAIPAVMSGDEVARRNIMINIVVKKPSDCSENELNSFEILVKKGGEVAAEGLRGRIKKAKWLIFLFENATTLAGVAALKSPNKNYKHSVFMKAESQEDPKEFTFEAGWIYVEEQFRGRKYSRQLLEKILKLAGDNHVYATTRENNKFMRHTNSRCGFKQSGHPYESESETEKYNLILYTRRSS